MLSNKESKLLAVYSLGHFLVDLISAFLMISLAVTTPEPGLSFLLIYNFCAFALQMPVGLIADKLNRNGAVAASGLALALLAFAFWQIPLVCATTVGLGNCLYHVGGGIDVLNFGSKKQWMLGVYVSPGAVGLFIGTLLAQGSVLSLPIGFIIMLVLSLVTVLLLRAIHPFNLPSKNPTPSIDPSIRFPMLTVILLMLVVVLRSYVGMTLSFEWKTGVWAVLAVLGLALGKAAGGLAADKFGAIRTTVISLAVCAVLFIFSGNAICGLLAIFLFNMTMPITLYAMAEIFPGAKGFAFGALTFALFLGYVPSLLPIPVPFYGEGWWYAAEALLSSALLVTGLMLCRSKGVKKDA